MFLERLRSTLDAPQIENLQWMPSGKAFHIVNPKKFSKEELPTIFKFKNMSSFLRKLNQLGFQRSLDKVTMNLDIFAQACAQQRHCQDRRSRLECVDATGLASPNGQASTARGG